MQGLSGTRFWQEHQHPQRLFPSICTKIGYLPPQSLHRGGDQSQLPLQRSTGLQSQEVDEPNPSARGGEHGRPPRLRRRLLQGRPPRHHRVFWDRFPRAGSTPYPSLVGNPKSRLRLHLKELRGVPRERSRRLLTSQRTIESLQSVLLDFPVWICLVCYVPMDCGYTQSGWFGVWIPLLSYNVQFDVSPVGVCVPCTACGAERLNCWLGRPHLPPPSAVCQIGNGALPLSPDAHREHHL